MGRKKLERFEEMEGFNNIFQPSPQEMYKQNFELKGKWQSNYFKNMNPIVLEVGCGKGEYTTGLAESFRNKNFIGIDIKGARLWRGCKTAIQKKLENVAFIRNKVEFLASFFENGEISEIWITFPDPQIKKMHKRLTSARFLNLYRQILNKQALVHLKTDSTDMFLFTKHITELNNLPVYFRSDNLYQSDCETEAVKIQTYYEKKFLEINKPITYTKFSLPENSKIINPEKDPIKK